MEYELSYEDYTKDAINGTIQKISRNAEHLMRVFTDAVMKNEIPEVWSSFAGSRDKMESLINYFEIPLYEEKQRIYYFAVIRTVLELGDTLSVQITEKNLSKVYSNYKYLYPTLEIMSKSGPLSQGQIAAKLGINSNSLSNFFRRTNRFELWSKEILGRKNYYSITAKGKRAYRAYLQNYALKENDNFEKIILTMLDALAKEMENLVPNIEKVLHMVNGVCNKGTSVFNSEAVNLKLHEVFYSREKGIRKRKLRQIREENEETWSKELTSYIILDSVESSYGDHEIKKVLGVY